jgi:ADP-heptose:LPS heptosyltransferase
MIGNDSGIGHLASCLNLPTLIICRSKIAAPFWRPGWTSGEVILPPAWIPNLKGLRFRDKYWQKSITVPKVLKSFNLLA